MNDLETGLRSALTPDAEPGLDPAAVLAAARRSRTTRALGAGLAGLTALALLSWALPLLGATRGVPVAPAGTPGATQSAPTATLWDPRAVGDMAAFVADFAVEPLAPVQPGTNAQIDWTTNPVTSATPARRAGPENTSDPHEVYLATAQFTRTVYGPIVWSSRDLPAFCTIWPAKDAWGQACFTQPGGTTAEAAARYFVMTPGPPGVRNVGTTFVRTKANFAVVTVPTGYATTAVLVRM